MAQVPITARNTVERQPLRNGEFRYAAPRNLVGPAVEGFGRALGQAADDFDHIEATYDQADVLNGETTYAVEGAAIRSEFANLRGDQPGRALPDYIKKLDDREEELLGAARSERARNLLRRNLQVRKANLQSTLSSHADEQMFSFRDAGLVAARNQSVRDSIDTVGTPQFDVQVGIGLTRIEERAALLGSPKETVELERAKFRDEVHGGVFDTMFAVPNPNVDAISSYLENRGKEMTPGLRAKVMERLQGPLQIRDDEADLLRSIGGIGGSFEEPAGAAHKPKAVTEEVSFTSPVVGGTPTSRFGVSRGAGKRHNGLDIAGPQGSAIKPIAGGVVSKVVPNGGDSGNWVEVTHADGSKSTYSHMGSFSVKQGQEISAGTVLGTIGMTGRTSGPHVHLVTRNAKGETVDPEKVIGTTARGVVGTTEEPREWDRDQVYNQIDTLAEQEGWSFEKRERVKKRADIKIQRDEGLLREKQDDAYDAALNIVAEKGDGFRLHMIPDEVRGNMTPVQLRNLKEIEEKLTAPKPVQANGADAIGLSLMPYYEPERFKSINLGQYAGKITTAELEAALVKQAALRTKPEAANTWSPRSGIVTALNYGKKINAMKLEPAQEASILGIMEGEAVRLHQANGGKPLTDNDYQALFRSATREVETRTSIMGIATGSSSKPRYELNLSTMPTATKERLSKRLKQGGLPVNDENLLRLYRLEAR